MMQWIDSVLAKGETIQFFYDEYRCPVYFKDLVHIIQALSIRWISGLMSFIYLSYFFTISNAYIYKCVCVCVCVLFVLDLLQAQSNVFFLF